MHKKTYLILLLICIVVLAAVIAFAMRRNDGETTSMDTAATPPAAAPAPKVGKVGRWYSQFPGRLPDAEMTNRRAVIATEKGNITIEFFPLEAPLAVSNFITLANDTYFDGLTFHRREEGFVIQGGDPSGNGTGGPGYTFPDELVRRPYTRGVVAMANRGPDTNGSQFFIMLGNTPLPPSYTIFGAVTEGMDVVDRIAVGDAMTTVTIQNNATPAE